MNRLSVCLAALGMMLGNSHGTEIIFRGHMSRDDSFLPVSAGDGADLTLTLSDYWVDTVDPHCGGRPNCEYYRGRVESISGRTYGNPAGWLDTEEPEQAARSVELMGLSYVVLTSVDRDDLADGGAEHYAAAVVAIRVRNPGTAVEALTPDFRGNVDAVRVVASTPLAVFAHNLETVRRLTPEVRDPRAGYDQSLAVLREAKTVRTDLLTKSSLMLGLGETEAEVLTAMDDLRAAGVDILTFGQYLRPTVNHLPVQRFVTPAEFLRYRELGLQRGFVEVVSGPLVRSSYRAEQALERNNAGLGIATGTTG